MKNKKLFYGFKKRAKVLTHYLRSPDKYRYLSWFEVLQFIFSPARSTIARNYIDRIIKVPDYRQVYFKNIPPPLFWPEELDIKYLITITTEIMYKKNWHYYEIPETMVMNKDIVLDCGAAEGLFSLSIYEKAERVYMLEPLPLFHHALSKTFYDINNCVLIKCALGATACDKFFVQESVNSHIDELGRQGTIKVPVETIDNLFFKKDIKVDYIKADLEGYELDMLQGATKTIQAAKPRMAITTYHEGQNANDIVAFVKSLVPDYNVRVKGIEEKKGNPVMLHFWI